jgi:hypothetical protein
MNWAKDSASQRRFTGQNGPFLMKKSLKGRVNYGSSSSQRQIAHAIARPQMLLKKTWNNSRWKLLRLILKEKRPKKSLWCQGG